MKPLKTLTATIKNLPGLSLHILLTDEDGVIVARCLDFSVSSHGENEEEALASLSDSMADYLDHASNQGAYHEIIDPDDEALWDIFGLPYFFVSLSKTRQSPEGTTDNSPAIHCRVGISANPRVP